MAGPESTPCTAHAKIALGAVFLQRDRGLHDRPGGVDDVVLDDARPAVHIADHVHHFRRAVVAAPLVDDRQLGVEPLRVGAGALGAAGVRRHDRQIRDPKPVAVVDDHRRREQVVHRDVEEPLDLRLVQIHRQHAIRARRAQQVRHQLRRDRHARLVLAILPRVPVIRDNRGDPRRRRPAERVDHHAQLDQVPVDVRAGRLHDEDIRAADVLVDLERALGVREPLQAGLTDVHAEKLGNLAREGAMRASRKELQLPTTHKLVRHAAEPARRMVGAEGFEPSNTGSKVPRLTAWPRPIVRCRVAPRWRFRNSGPEGAARGHVCKRLSVYGRNGDGQTTRGSDTAGDCAAPALVLAARQRARQDGSRAAPRLSGRTTRGGRAGRETARTRPSRCRTSPPRPPRHPAARSSVRQSRGDAARPAARGR